MLLILAACGSDFADSAETASSDAPAEGVNDASADFETVDASGDPLPDVASAQAGRSIIFTAHLDIVADNVDLVTREAAIVVERLGGYVFGEETHRSGGASSTLTFKIPPEQFRAALNQLGELGEVSFQNVSSDDVTDIVVDLQSRIATSEVSVTRLRELLDESGTISDIAEVEGQLLQRETTLEQLRGQLRSLEAQTSLSTITFSVSETAPEPEKDSLPGVLDAISGGFKALVTVLYAIALVMAAILPWVPVFGIVFFGGRWIIRKVRSRRPVPAPLTPPVAEDRLS